MKQLKVLLDQAVAETKFDMGNQGESRDTSSITFRGRSEEIKSSEQFRTSIVNTQRNDDLSLRIPSANMIIPDDLLTPVVTAVHEWLVDYVDSETGKIGHAFPIGSSSSQERVTVQQHGMVSIRCISPVKEFSTALVKSAVILGSERILNLLSYWMKKNSVQYSVYAILNGLFLTGKLNPLPDIHMQPLPWSTDALPNGLPRSFGSSDRDFLGRTLLKLNATSSPALFQPGNGKREVLPTIELPFNLDLRTISEALTLQTENYVDVALYWNDFQDVASMELARSSGVYSHGSGRGGIQALSIEHSMSTDFSTNSLTLNVDSKYKSNLSETRFGDILKAIASPRSDKVQVSISRWCKSKESSKTIVDQFIDLRIALETLYLRDFGKEQSMEMRFRLALFGAWHLGTHFSERKEIRKTLRDAYDVASAAVHGGKLKREDNVKLLSRAQSLCLRGIEKFLNEGPPEDWGDLILGSYSGDLAQDRHD